MNEFAAALLGPYPERLAVDVLKRDGWRDIQATVKKARQRDAGLPINQRGECSRKDTRNLYLGVVHVYDPDRDRGVLFPVGHAERVRPAEAANFERRVEARTGVSSVLLEAHTVLHAVCVPEEAVREFASLVDVQALIRLEVESRRPVEPPSQ